MVIYGVALLAICYLTGQIIGELLGRMLGVESNVGGVGFAMLFLILAVDWLKKKELISPQSEDGMRFWTQMYIPIVIAMSAIQNVRIAISSGMIALLGGIVPVMLCLMLVPIIAKHSKAKAGNE